MGDEHGIIRSGPLKGMRVRFASTSQLEGYQAIADDFIERVLGLEPEECLLSDESSLSARSMPKD